MYEGRSIWTPPDMCPFAEPCHVLFMMKILIMQYHVLSKNYQYLFIFFLFKNTYLFRTKLASHFHVWLTVAATEHIPDITFLQNDCICRHGDDRAPEGKDDIKMWLTVLCVNALNRIFLFFFFFF